VQGSACWEMPASDRLDWFFIPFEQGSEPLINFNDFEILTELLEIVYFTLFRVK
jgi:hypothetical protein